MRTVKKRGKDHQFQVCGTGHKFSTNKNIEPEPNQDPEAAAGQSRQPPCFVHCSVDVASREKTRAGQAKARLQWLMVVVEAARETARLRWRDLLTVDSLSPVGSDLTGIPLYPCMCSV